MIWVAWRQHRAQLLLMAALLLVGGVTVVVLHAIMAGRAGTLDCGESAACEAAWSSWTAWYDPIRAGQLLLVLLPVLLGAFGGASVFGREIEQRTHVFAFTQSVGRLRWMTVKLATVLLPSLVLVVVLQLLLNSWAGLARTQAPVTFGSFTYLNTESAGLLPAGYLLLAFAAGAWIGAAWGRTLPATITTLAGLAVVRLAVGFGAPWLIPTRIRTFPVAYAGEPPFAPDMLVRWGYLGPGGRRIPSSELVGCLTPDELRDGACFARHGVTGEFAEIIPASAVPALRAIEFGVFAVAAVLLVWATARTLRRQE